MRYSFISKYSRIIFALLILISSGACAKQKEATAYDFDLTDLLITSDFVPAGWRIEFQAGEFISSYYAEEAVQIVFVPDTGVRRATGHSIYRFSSSKAAQIKLHGEFIPKVLNSGEFVPAGWIPPSLSADEDKFVCYWKAVDADPEKYMLCEWNARYDEFVVFLVSWVLPDLMSLDQIKDMIVEADRRMTERPGNR